VRINLGDVLPPLRHSGFMRLVASSVAPVNRWLLNCRVALILAACFSGCATSVDFTLPQTTGCSFHLHVVPAQPVLLAFLQTVPDTADTDSRREAVFIASMARQYGRRGLRVAAIDATEFATGIWPGHDALVNAASDWQMNYPLLEDADGRVARQFGVDKIPTVVLLTSSGRIYLRWDGFVRPSALAEAIKQLIPQTAIYARSTIKRTSD
jgi:peroxiredoxin